MLGQHVPHYRPAPVIAMTATATTLVQHDIVEQLGLRQAALFIHGFRRANIAVEVVEAPPSERADLARELLQDEWGQLAGALLCLLSRPALAREQKCLPDSLCRRHPPGPS